MSNFSKHLATRSVQKLDDRVGIILGSQVLFTFRISSLDLRQIWESRRPEESYRYAQVAWALMRVEPLYGQAVGIGKLNNRVLCCDESLDSALPISTSDYCTSHYVALDVPEFEPVDSENSSSLLFDVARLCQVSDQNSLDFESYPTMFATPQASRIIPFDSISLSGGDLSNMAIP